MNYLKIIKKAKKIALFSHASPDPDTIGSTIALFNALSKVGKSVDLFCEDEISENYKFLEETANYNNKKFDKDNYDLLIAVDIAGLNMLGKFQEGFDTHENTMRIDHHAMGELKSKLDIVKTYSACAILVYETIKKLKIKIDEKIATPLYFALCGDTGIFRNNNTDSLTFKVASELLNLGANIRKVYAEFFDKKNVSYLKLTSSILLNAETNDEVGYAVMTAPAKDFEKFDVSTTESVGNLANTYLSCGYKIAAVLKEKEDGIHGSFRSKFEYDVAEIARTFDGGGHKNAAGFLIKKDLESAKKDVVEAVEKYLKNLK
jgi:phosphoesterase RecJ-like protein